MNHILIIAQLGVLICQLAISLWQGHGLLIACEDLIGDESRSWDRLLVSVQVIEAVLISSAEGILSSLATVINLDLLHAVMILTCGVLHTLVLHIQLDCRGGLLLILPYLTVRASGFVMSTMRWRIDYYFTVLSLFTMAEYRLLESSLMLVGSVGIMLPE